ncbi:MAG: cardiolipin synthase, partial [Paramuribaculum sp.]|nr:cardiolipin synthase [Paramuribaculum sp.]
LQYSFAVDWRFMGRELIEEGVAGAEAAGGVAATPGDAGMNLLTCGPTSEWSNISYMLLKAIGNAKKRVWVQTPYFLPTESLLKGLQAAALSRVDVRVMMPRRSDSAILTYASRSYVQECLLAGVKIYFYDGGMLHSKVVVVDDDFSSVGSANIDFRSFEHNFEANMMIYSQSVNSRLRRRFEEDQACSERVRGAEWRRRPVMHKALESIVRLMSPVL